ncbi:hypothetical protein FDJ58_gp109 [Bacillus phage SIOphi]|uniref:Uncharacterized protein n=1 Tax=Bacillus phage SIOphi TaxID=1285382 RepID=R4JDU0_9CAUD|nr:hypothetical protein FDJ58_gp109 [Bacillus phage SIOphi]AGK86917.1 hypothetical protein SIOphi_00545 [Bacillus phage SIOphi]
MANLYGPILRKPPVYTKRQVEALNFLVSTFDLTEICKMMVGGWDGNNYRELGSWEGGSACLNLVKFEDLMYTLVTGEYDVREETFEDYLEEKISHRKAQGEHGYADELSTVLEKYREFDRTETLLPFNTLDTESEKRK